MASGETERTLVPVVVPDLRAGAQPLELVQWLVDPGTPVHEGDRIAELLVAGIVFHLAAPANGILERLERASHSRVSTGDVLAWIAADSTAD